VIRKHRPKSSPRAYKIFILGQHLAIALIDFDGRSDYQRAAHCHITSA